MLISNLVVFRLSASRSLWHQELRARLADHIITCLQKQESRIPESRLPWTAQKRKPVSPQQYVDRALEAFGKKAKVSMHTHCKPFLDEMLEHCCYALSVTPVSLFAAHVSITLGTSFSLQCLGAFPP